MWLLRCRICYKYNCVTWERWSETDPVHDEDLVDVESLLQQFGCDGHRVEITETPETAEKRGRRFSRAQSLSCCISMFLQCVSKHTVTRTWKINKAAFTQYFMRRLAQWFMLFLFQMSLFWFWYLYMHGLSVPGWVWWRLWPYMGVLSSAWCPGGRTTAKPFCRERQKWQESESRHWSPLTVST